jgi:hypothetical protein
MLMSLLDGSVRGFHTLERVDHRRVQPDVPVAVPSGAGTGLKNVKGGPVYGKTGSAGELVSGRTERQATPSVRHGCEDFP